MRFVYQLWYRFGRPPWVGDARSELVELVESGRLTAGRAIDLGCGVGDNAVFLAEHGFEVVGVDYAASAIEQAREKATAAGVPVEFVVDDLTALRHVRGTFDLLVDYGTFDDLSAAGRQRYLRNVVPLASPGARFLLWCFEWTPRWWERLLAWVLPLDGLALDPREVRQRFSPWFEIERIAGEQGRAEWPPGYGVYLMTRNAHPFGRSPGAGTGRHQISDATG